MKRSARRLVAGAILLAALLLAMALPYLASSFYVNVATQVLFFGLFGMSIDLLGGYTGLMPLGHAGILGVGGYSMGYGLSRLGWSWPQAAAVALLLTVLVSLVFGLLAVRTTGIFFVMITMAEGMLVWGLAYRWASVTGAENGLRGINRPEFAVLYWQYYYFALLVFLVSALALTLIVRSPLVQPVHQPDRRQHHPVHGRHPDGGVGRGWHPAWPRPRRRGYRPGQESAEHLRRSLADDPRFDIHRRGPVRPGRHRWRRSPRLGTLTSRAPESGRSDAN